MTKRINPETGYPMSTDKQIKRAKEILELSQQPSGIQQEIDEGMEDVRDKKTKFSDKISEITNKSVAKGNYLYKVGDWDRAENEFLQYFYLQLFIAEKLRVLYQKEHRFKDAYYIMKFTDNVHNEFPDINLVNDWVTKKFKANLKSTKNKAEKNISIDKSIIDNESKTWIVKNANLTLKKIFKIKKEIFK